MSFFSFLTNKKFYINLSIAIVLSLVLFWLVFVFLGFYTRHGETIPVPDFTGKTLTELQNEETLNQFEFVLLDSIYDPDYKKGSIVMQDPLPYAKVKEGRKIYITTVAKMPEKVGMPDLVDLSLRQALVTLESVDLRINRLNYVPHFAENAVLAQLYQGDTIQPGTLIEKGTAVNLVVGEGHGSPLSPVPFLIGRTMPEAHSLIYKGTFNIGKEYFMDEADTIHMRVYKQSPGWEDQNMAAHGKEIDLWYRSELDFDFDEYILSLLPDTTALDSLGIDSLHIENSAEINFENLE